MRKARRWLLAALAASCLLICVCEARSAAVKQEEMAEAGRWIATHVADPTAANTRPAQPPFSFLYGGRASAELLKAWSFSSRERALDDRRTEHRLVWSDPQSRLEVRCVAIVYRDFPTVEWTLYFRNAGRADTPLLESIQALDCALGRGWQGEPALHHNKGALAEPDDYQPRQTALASGVVARLGTNGGRPCNRDLPYFNMAWPGAGAIVAVGWPGQWAATLAREASGAVRVRAGQETTRFVLHPGEEVRTPLIALQFWKGDRIESQNTWRRWMVAHNLPRPGGKLPPPLFLACSSHQFGEMIGANEANQIQFIDGYLAHGLRMDYWWMDAGWYKNDGTWVNVGTWEVDPKRFPRGLRAITDHARSKGVRSILWFEPERVTKGTWLYENHPEWLLAAAPNPDDPIAGLVAWSDASGDGNPCVTYNPLGRARSVSNTRWEPGRLALHPGAKGEYGVVRWKAPEAGEFSIRASFVGIDQQTTTDVHVVHRGRSVFDSRIDNAAQPKQASYKGKLAVARGDAIDFLVGWGNGSHACDSTGLEVSLTGPGGKSFHAAKEFCRDKNPSGVWTYGSFKPGATPDAGTFRPFDRTVTVGENAWRLLNLGNHEAWAWLVEHIDRTLREQGIDLYRQDFNMDPLDFWRGNDAPDRQGITEIRYVTGYLAYWDELRRRHPGMLIDSCASGGRRNDLETLRRAVPLIRSDHLFEPTSQQCHHYGASLWYPFHGTGTLFGETKITPGLASAAPSVYEFRSHMAANVTSCWDVRRPDLDYALLRTLAGQLRQVQPCYLGDYYPLTEYTGALDAWMAWQFDRPDLRMGVVQAFRRPKCERESLRVKLRGLDPEAAYTLRDLDATESKTHSGRELMEQGLVVARVKKPDAAVIVYERR